jgi:hypothetical protein
MAKTPRIRIIKRKNPVLLKVQGFFTWVRQITIFNSMKKRNFEFMVKRIINAMLKKGAKPLGYGRHKATFAYKNLVYRVPISVFAFKDVILESEIYNATDEHGNFYWNETSWNGEIRDKRYIKPARTRLIYIKDIPIQVMEKVIPLCRSEAFSRKEPWLKHLERGNDGRQIGRNKDGEIRAFDFSDIADCLNYENSVISRANEKSTEYANRFSGDIMRISLNTDFLRKKGVQLSPGSPDSIFIERNMDILRFT